jgi:DNA invertase Pin-like site-specific DNA recombinase
VLVAARLDRITRRAHTLSQLLEDGVSIRAADMPGADDLMLRIDAAMAQKERELISERTEAALAAAKARGKVLGGDRGYRPAAGPDAAAAARARRVGAERAAHRLALEIEQLGAEGITGHAALARALNDRGVPTPRGKGLWTYTTVARLSHRTTRATNVTRDERLVDAARRSSSSGCATRSNCSSSAVLPSTP